jgi:hypothetical protein
LAGGLLGGGLPPPDGVPSQNHPFVTEREKVAAGAAFHPAPGPRLLPCPALPIGIHASGLAQDSQAPATPGCPGAAEHPRITRLIRFTAMHRPALFAHDLDPKPIAFRDSRTYGRSAQG